MAITVIDNFQINAAKLADNREGPYASIAEATSSVSINSRQIGLRAIITGSGVPVEYWYSGGISNSNLVPKNSLTINNNTSSYVLTATGLNNTITGNINFQFDGNNLFLTGSQNISGSLILTGSMSIIGNVSASAFYQVSSRTMKTNIEPFTGSGLNIMGSVQVVRFNYLNDLQNSHIGFIAEDTPTELSTINQNVMDTNSTIGVLIKAVQELTTRVNELERNKII